jgi:excisionase family DNA binding protein
MSQKPCSRRRVGRSANLAGLYLPEVGVVEDVAAHMRLSPGTVRRMIREGKLTGRKLGGRWYVTRRALLACLENVDPAPMAHPDRRWSLLSQDGGEE